MMFQNISYEDLLKRMLDRVDREVDKSEGEILWDALSPAAAELTWMYICLDEVLKQSFGDTASRDFLIRRAAERAVYPTEATHAVMLGVFAPQSIDVMGQRFSLGTHNYVVTKSLGGGQYEVTCEVSGSEGHKHLGPLVPIDYIQGLQSARLISVLVNGQDEEETEHLRQRYLSSFGAMAFGGNRKDYLDKTNGIAGVGATKVIPVWRGGGTVKLIILDSEYGRATDTLITRVQETIDPTGDAEGLGLAPIGHVVTVVTAEERVVEITATVTLEIGVSWHQVEQAVQEAVEGHFRSLRASWSEQDYLVVRVSQVENAFLSVRGVVDIQFTALSGLDENIQLRPEEIPVLGGITVHEGA